MYRGIEIVARDLQLGENKAVARQLLDDKEEQLLFNLEFLAIASFNRCQSTAAWIRFSCQLLTTLRLGNSWFLRSSKQRMTKPRCRVISPIAKSHALPEAGHFIGNA